MKRIVWLLSCLCLATPLFAHAQDAYVAADISLQAGPDTEYPAITELAAGTPVSIEGCVDSYTWCDVVAGDDRGWVPGSFLEEDFDNQRVIVVDYGPRIRIPIVTFSLGVYWGQHYHNRPWFGERERWESRHIQPRAVPKPAAIANGPHEERRVRADHANAHGAQPAARPTAAPVATPAPKIEAAPRAHTEAAPHTEPVAHPANEATPRVHAGAQEEKHEPRPPSATAHNPPPQPKAATPQPPPHVVSPPKQPAPKAEPKEPKQPPPKKEEGDKKGGDAKDHD